MEGVAKRDGQPLLRLLLLLLLCCRRQRLTLLTCVGTTCEIARIRKAFKRTVSVWEVGLRAVEQPWEEGITAAAR